MDHPFLLKMKDGHVLSVKKGFSLVASMAMTGPMAFMNKWTGIEELAVTASYDFTSKVFHLEGDIGMHWQLGEHLAFTQASLFLDIGGKTRHGRDTVKSVVCGVIVCVRVLLCDMLCCVCVSSQHVI
jgi:hypothetical protein